MKMKNYNVLIIGSGPAGLFAAIELEKLGLDKIAIIDSNPYPAGGLLNDGIYRLSALPAGYLYR